MQIVDAAKLVAHHRVEHAEVALQLADGRAAAQVLHVGVDATPLLADAFADQTALLDKRDASYGRHQAQVRMGTVNGARKNYVELTVVTRGSREVLTVKLSRL